MSQLTDILNTLEKIGDDSYDETTRYQIKEASRKLVAKLELPFERAWGVSFEQSTLFAATQVFVDRGLWAKWREAGPVQTGEQLAALDGVIDVTLLRRLLRFLAAFFVIDEVDVDTFKLNRYSEAIGAEDELIRMVIEKGNDTFLEANRNIPAFLKKTNYAEPLDNVTSIFSNAFGGQNFFQYCAENPRANKSFISLMQAITAHKMAWTDVYDTRSLFQGVEIKADRPLFCDIGGGHGQDVERLRAKHAELIPKGTLYLQDLPNVVEIAKLHPDIQGKAYDFFEPQYLTGARAYFSHCVLHDWPDKDCLRILKRMAEACERGYTKILLYEVVLPPKGATALMSSVDLLLMTLCSAFERKEAAWHDLCKQAGLKIVKIWSHPRAVESVIEIELA